MFPNIEAGDVIVIDGDKHLVVMHMPDALAILTLGAGNHRVFQLSFEDIEQIHAAGLLHVQGPLTPRVPEANADD